ncbi:hypothetical protein N0V83_009966 [Neocucurbitaria cava]|uniref:Fungal lipase-type domain-containing protein n=1 Tax=Neocucurbitaria cava TaxID=798079 RepID=A0A9W8Y034_9PLEO|nr:hypothetical protein N0V83_009966 [Neocucurbitaria cava]
MPRPREEGLLKEQWNRLDKMATKSYTNLRDGTVQSVTKMTTNYIERPTHAVATKSMQTLCKGAALCDIISTKFDAVMTSIDDERFSGKEQDLMIYNDNDNYNSLQQQTTSSSRSSPPLGEPTPRRQSSNDVYPASSSEKGSNHFSKVWLYSNSRLPPHLPPFKVYMPTYPLLCLAATYSERVYTPPLPTNTTSFSSSATQPQTETHIPSSWRSGTKAMVLKSVPIEDLNTIVFAIRGSQTFMDWAVNYNSAPSPPGDFLADDPTNLCHAGFLYVARKMVRPVAAQLRRLLEENPARSNCSLLITGHSAGGAVASLLYAHMTQQSSESGGGEGSSSELSYLTGFFKRVHCITFGAPPVSLRPLRKSSDARHRKSLFYAFVNEGDPVPRADKGVVRSLLKLYASPAPVAASAAASAVAATTVATSMSKLNLSQLQNLKPPKSRLKFSLTRPSKTAFQTTATTTSSSASASSAPLPAWPIPPCTLAPAGRLIILRQRPGSTGNSNRPEEDNIEAVTVEQDMLKKVVYGDPLKHQMRVYRKRIEEVAVRAVTAGGY